MTRIFRRIHVVALGLISAGLFGAIQAAAETTLDDERLSFEERVRCHRTIEEVYWRHRIWPEANPAPKPALDEVLPDTAIRERVATQLQKSAALGILWSRPLTGEQLQAELDRMARGTRSPEFLRELFAALDNDPFLAAECLARPALTERLTRNWHARDARFHGELRTRAEAALVAYRGAGSRLAELGGEYAEREWRIAADPADPSAFGIDAERWRDQISLLARSFGVETESANTYEASDLLARIPIDRLSSLIENDDAFVVKSVLSSGSDRVRVATVHWRKPSLDRWWADEGRAFVASTGGEVAIAPPPGRYRLPSPRDSGCSIDTWTELWYAPTPRTNHSAVWTGAEMIVWGGNDGQALSTGGRYDPATDTWTRTSTVGAPVSRYDHTAIWTGSEMVVWGGRSQPSAGALNSGGRYDPATDSWMATSLGSLVPSSRYEHTSVWTGAEMIVWGGYSGFDRLNTGARYDPATDSWSATSLSSGVPSARNKHTSVWTDTGMIVWGGSGDSDALDTGGRYVPATDSWTVTSTDTGVPITRFQHSAVWTGSEMIVWGGQARDVTWFVTNTGGRYDPATDSWTATSVGAGVPAARMHHTAIWTGSEMIVWGEASVTGGRYDPATDSWTATSISTGVPKARQGHTAIWTGTEMIVWGGFRGEDIYRNSGGRYDPISDSWTPTGIGAAGTAARVHPSAVWTGSEMIVWGGYDPYDYMNSGGRYDPALDSWTATELSSVPTARYAHAAIWTGTEMIVWGGGNWMSEEPITGGRYNPATHRWTSTSTVGAPSGRLFPTGVWTGTEMIVWGGKEFHYEPPPPMWNFWYVEVDSGGRYDPSSDSWVATSTGPTARSGHTAIWTGREMIVWGGYDNGSFRDGKRYDLTTDSWTPTSIDGAPEERSNHSAVWTGTEMIVWGGNRGSTLFTSGGRYDPASDSWSATASGSHVPVGTRDRSAVWTGAEMIVWGGKIDDSRYNTGARYHPASDSWIATSTAPGVPTGRSGHAAAWTGSEMIVWGGATEVWTENSGGLYCACEGGDVSVWYPDTDGDGHGANSTGVPYCKQPMGHIPNAGDCDDLTATCIDDCTTDIDADGLIDCADHCLDADGDLHGAPGGAGFLCEATDCDDTSPACTLDCSDPDADDFPDCRDNCPGVHNPSQIDIDGDGWGGAVGCDCTDTNYNVYPGAEEINDGLDNQCPGDEGHGLIDEIGSDCGFHSPDNDDEFSWPAQPRATGYRVARSADPLFSAGCHMNESPQTSWIDTDPVPEETCFHYLVQATSPRAGSWGANSEGVGRTGICP